MVCRNSSVPARAPSRLVPPSANYSPARVFVVDRGQIEELKVSPRLAIEALAADARAAIPLVLVATQDGLGLYTALRWKVHSPGTSAVVPGPRAEPIA